MRQWSRTVRGISFLHSNLEIHLDHMSHSTQQKRLLGRYVYSDSQSKAAQCPVSSTTHTSMKCTQLIRRLYMNSSEALSYKCQVTRCGQRRQRQIWFLGRSPGLPVTKRSTTKDFSSSTDHDFLQTLKLKEQIGRIVTSAQRPHAMPSRSAAAEGCGSPGQSFARGDEAIM